MAGAFSDLPSEHVFMTHGHATPQADQQALIAVTLL
jgi:hypothetical protein